MKNTDRKYHFKNEISEKLKCGIKIYFLGVFFTQNDCFNICYLFLCFSFTFVYLCINISGNLIQN